MMRYGRLRGTMEQCLREIQESQLPGEFLLTQVRSLVRYLREVDGLCGHIKKESGWESDTTAYLEILCAKEDSTLVRRVSDTRILKQDFDEKRRDWRRAKKNVINSISEMCARALKFECSERKTVALHAIQYYKNVMAKDDGAIPGESESTDGLIDQYRRHRDEISKIPMYADSIMKMLKDIRRTVNATSKLPGSSAFTQFLEEWWASVVRFLEHSSIVDAEKNAREVMQTLKKLKGKQEENRKREMLRLMSMLDAKDKEAPLMTPTSGPVEIVDDSINPENTVRCNEWKKDSEEPSNSNGRELCTVSQGDDQGDDSIADEGDTEHEYDENEGHDEIDHDIDHDNGNADDEDDGDEEDDDHDERMDEISELASGHGDATGSAWSEADVTPRNRRGSRGFTSMSSMSGLHRNMGSVSVGSWDAASEPTLGTDTGTDRDVAAASGLPEGESDDDDGEEDFEAADSLDLGAVALCTVGTGADGHQTYQDATCTPQAMRHINERVGVEQERFSAALDYFRQEQREKGKRPAMPPPPGSSRYQLGGGRGRGASRRGRGRNFLSGRGHRDTLRQANGVLNGSSYQENALYASNTAITSSSRHVQGQGSFSARKRATVILSASAQTSSKMPATGIRRDS